MGDSHYPSRRFYETDSEWGGPEFGYGLNPSTVWEAIPKADMDALRDLARKARRIEHDGSLMDVMEACEALSPAFLESLEKP